MTREDLVLYRENKAEKNLLFHGTLENISGGLKVGGIDGVLWTSEYPTISQCYIPDGGLKALKPVLMDYQKKMSVRPVKGDFWFSVVVRDMGYDLNDERIKWGKNGFEAESWPCIYPTYEECMKHIESKGYSEGDDWLKIGFSDGKEVLLEKGYERSGKVFVGCKRGLKLKDLRCGESDLMNLEYYNVDGFEKAEREGYDGVIINDFAQTDEGNMGHVSIGLFQNAVDRMEWGEYEAKRFGFKGGLRDVDIKSTVEFDEYCENTLSTERGMDF